MAREPPPASNPNEDRRDNVLRRGGKQPQKGPKWHQQLTGTYKDMLAVLRNRSKTLRYAMNRARNEARGAALILLPEEPDGDAIMVGHDEF